MAQVQPTGKPDRKHLWRHAERMSQQLNSLNFDIQAPTHLWYRPDTSALYCDGLLDVRYRDISDEALENVKFQAPFQAQPNEPFVLTVGQLNKLVEYDRQILFHVEKFNFQPLHLSDEDNLRHLESDIQLFDVNKAFANPEDYPDHCTYFGSHSFRYAYHVDPKLNRGVEFHQLDPRKFNDGRARIWREGVTYENDVLVGFYHNADRNRRCPVFASKQTDGLMDRSGSKASPNVAVGRWPITAFRHPPSLFHFISEPIQNHRRTVTVEEDCFMIAFGNENEAGRPWVELLYVVNNGRSQPNCIYQFQTKDKVFANREITVFIIVGGDNPGEFTDSLAGEASPIIRGKPWTPDVWFTIDNQINKLPFKVYAVDGHEVGRYLMSARAFTRRMGTLGDQSQYEGKDTPIHYRNVGNRSEDNPQFHYSKMWSLRFPHNRLCSDTEFARDDLVMRCVGERACDRSNDPEYPKSKAEMWASTPDEGL